MTKPMLSRLGPPTRREFLGTLGTGAALLAASQFAAAADLTGGDPWEQIPSILQRIKPPTFPDRSFDLAKYGAVGDSIDGTFTATVTHVMNGNAAHFLSGSFHVCRVQDELTP